MKDIKDFLVKYPDAYKAFHSWLTTSVYQEEFGSEKENWYCDPILGSIIIVFAPKYGKKLPNEYHPKQITSNGLYIVDITMQKLYNKGYQIFSAMSYIKSIHLIVGEGEYFVI